MKHSRSRDLMLQMDRLVQLIQDSLNEELAQVLFHYLLNGSEHVTVTFCRRWRSVCPSTRTTL